MKYILKGTIVTFNESGDIINDGFVCVDEKKIVSVAAKEQDIPSNFNSVAKIETGGYIYPGLIDLHNHLPFDFLPLWKIDGNKPFRDRYEWPRLKRYELEISTPANLLAITNGVELVKYCEVKSLIGGVTTIDGSRSLKELMQRGYLEMWRLNLLVLWNLQFSRAFSPSDLMSF